MEHSRLYPTKRGGEVFWLNSFISINSKKSKSSLDGIGQVKARLSTRQRWGCSANAGRRRRLIIIALAHAARWSKSPSAFNKKL